MITSSALARGLALPVVLLCGAQAAAPGSSPTQHTITSSQPHDGSQDFDFLIGDWTAHVRRLPDRLSGSDKWVEYEGRSNHRNILGSRANFEDFEVWNRAEGLHLKAQTLRLYNPETRQWSIYPVDVDAGTLGLPAVVGEFTNGVGEFYDQEPYKGRAILVRYRWYNRSSKSARMEQSFSPDGGKNWEVNWICELSR